MRFAPGLSCDSSVSCHGAAPSPPLLLLSRELGLGLLTPHPALLPGTQPGSCKNPVELGDRFWPRLCHQALSTGSISLDASLASAVSQNKSFEAWKAVPVCPGCPPSLQLWAPSPSLSLRAGVNPSSLAPQLFLCSSCLDAQGDQASGHPLAREPLPSSLPWKAAAGEIIALVTLSG